MTNGPERHSAPDFNQFTQGELPVVNPTIAQGGNVIDISSLPQPIHSESTRPSRFGELRSITIETTPSSTTETNIKPIETARAAVNAAHDNASTAGLESQPTKPVHTPFIENVLNKQTQAATDTSPKSRPKVGLGRRLRNLANIVSKRTGKTTEVPLYFQGPQDDTEQTVTTFPTRPSLSVAPTEDQNSPQALSEEASLPNLSQEISGSPKDNEQELPSTEPKNANDGENEVEVPNTPVNEPDLINQPAKYLQGQNRSLSNKTPSPAPPRSRRQPSLTRKASPQSSRSEAAEAERTRRIEQQANEILEHEEARMLAMQMLSQHSNREDSSKPKHKRDENASMGILEREIERRRLQREDEIRVMGGNPANVQGIDEVSRIATKERLHDLATSKALEQIKKTAREASAKMASQKIGTDANLPITDSTLHLHLFKEWERIPANSDYAEVWLFRGVSQKNDDPIKLYRLRGFKRVQKNTQKNVSEALFKDVAAKPNIIGGDKDSRLAATDWGFDAAGNIYMMGYGRLQLVTEENFGQFAKNVGRGSSPFTSKIDYERFVGDIKGCIAAITSDRTQRAGMGNKTHRPFSENSAPLDENQGQGSNSGTNEDR